MSPFRHGTVANVPGRKVAKVDVVLAAIAVIKEDHDVIAVRSPRRALNHPRHPQVNPNQSHLTPNPLQAQAATHVVDAAVEVAIAVVRQVQGRLQLMARKQIPAANPAINS